MIQTLRNNAALIMWIVIIAFVATIVFAWGMDITSRNRVKDTVGKVNGKEISLRNFERMVNLESEKYAGKELKDEKIRSIRRQVWEMEVSRILLRDLFNKMKIGASSDEIFDYIKRNPPPEVYSVPQFKTDSVFDTSKFIAFLNNPAVYENEGMLALEKHTEQFSVPMQTLRILLSMQEFPFKSEVEYQYKEETEKAVFEYAEINPQKFNAPIPSEEKIMAYYKAHQDSFSTDEMVNLSFIKIPKISTEADEKAIYDELVNLRLKLNPLDSSFILEAKNESDDEATASNGGYLGWIVRGTTDPQFDSAVFTVKVNEISMPVKTKFGYHLILVEKREKKDGKEQALVRHIFRKIMPSAETLDRLSALVDSLHETIAEEGIKKVDISKLNTNIIVDSTGFFKRGEMIPKIGYLSGAGSFAFNHGENEVSEILENEEGYYILQIKKKIKKGILPLEVVKGKIIEAISDSLRKDIAYGYFKEFISKVPDKNSVASFSKYDSLIVSGVTDTVEKTRYIPNVGYNNKAVSVAFELPLGKVSPIIEASGSYFVVKPLWQKKVQKPIPWATQEVLNIHKRMIEERLERSYYDWYLYYKSSAKIEDNLNQFYLD